MNCLFCVFFPEHELNQAEISVAVVVPVACVVILGLLMAYVLIFHFKKIKRLMQPPCKIPEDVRDTQTHTHTADLGYNGSHSLLYINEEVMWLI